MKEILIIDVEATCWRGPNPAGQENEIIEIGLCRLDTATGERLENRSILVRPERSTISDFCTELTTITPGMLANAILFREACALLVDKYNSQTTPWGSWGDYDRNQFTRQCRSFGIPYPFGPDHTNIKKRFAQLHDLEKGVGMATALQMLDLPLEGTHHRGGDDAANIARIYAVMLQQEALTAPA
jgi:inhibitor of KinA sporulation pathway (predicted exonuclease)